MDNLLNELEPYVAEGLGILILAILSAMGGFATWALAALRSWLETKGLIAARQVLDETIYRAKAAFPPDRIAELGGDVQLRLADYLMGYVRETSPRILRKLKVDDSALTERMMKEAAIWLKQHREFGAATDQFGSGAMR